DGAKVVGNEALDRLRGQEVQLSPPGCRPILVERVADEGVLEGELGDRISDLRHEARRHALFCGPERALRLDAGQVGQHVESELLAENCCESQDSWRRSGEPLNARENRLTHPVRETRVTIADAAQDLGREEGIAAGALVQIAADLYAGANGKFVDFV